MGVKCEFHDFSPEALVAWDRDMGPHMSKISSSRIRCFSYSGAGAAHGKYQVIFLDLPDSPAYVRHDARYFEQLDVWLSTIKGDSYTSDNRVLHMVYD